MTNTRTRIMAAIQNPFTQRGVPLLILRSGNSPIRFTLASRPSIVDVNSLYDSRQSVQDCVQNETAKMSNIERIAQSE